MENDPGYFLGSIICVNPGGNALAPELELVDGQQRMTTVSLLLAAAYGVVESIDDSDWNEDQKSERVVLKRNLVHRDGRLRVIPQIQGSNNGDYSAVMAEVGVFSSDDDRPPNAGNRRIYRAFRFFQKHVEEIKGDLSGQDARHAVMDFVAKIHNASMVKIEVGNHAAAHTLFEALNNRGEPLTAIDIIKNKLLARLGRDNPGDTLRPHFLRWNKILKHLGGEEKSELYQERFLRQHYNAFRFLLNSGGAEAKRSNLIALYEKLVDENPEGFLSKLAEAGRDYGLLLRTHKDNDRLSGQLRERLEKLDRIEGVPSYVLLLFLLTRKDALQLTDKHFGDVLDFLARFFVRRNLTDKPPTRDLTRLFMAINEKIHEGEKTGDDAVETVKSELRRVSASDDDFRRALNGPIYEDNRGVTRFVLCELCRENKEGSDLWKRQGKDYVWSIEHIFPQGERIPDCWVNMVGGGDTDRAKEKAKEIQQSHVHKLGNLTLSGYNSNLGTKSFAEKRDACRDDKFIGYKNGLKINSCLADRDDWNAESIDARTQRLVEEAERLFNLGMSA